MKNNIAILVSGNGGFSITLHNNLNILKNTNLSVVISDRNCNAIKYFKEKTKIPSYVFEYSNYENKEKFETDILNILKKYRVKYIFLNYNRLIGKTILDKYKNKIINLHLSLLPSHKGLSSLSNSFQSNELFYGATTHIVDDSIDGGHIINQVILPKLINEGSEKYNNRLFRLAALLFLDTVYKVTNLNIIHKSDKSYFDKAKYGTIPFNPKLSIDPSKIVFKKI